MKKPIIILTLLTVTAGLILVTLDRLMGNPNMKAHGFTRKFKNVQLVKEKEFRLNKNFHNIAGIKNDKVYLGNQVPGEVLIIDVTTGDFRDEKIDVPVIKNFTPAFQTVVDYPNIYISGMNARKIVKGNLQENKIAIYDVPGGSLMGSAIISDSDAIIRCLDTSTYEMLFRRVNLLNGAIEKTQEVAPVKNFDIYSYDGVMHFDNRTNTFVYINHYSNGIARFDATLGNIERQKGVDTMNSPKAYVARMGESITFKAPPTFVNKRSAFYNDKVYINSGLIADNESYNLFNASAVIDVYDKQYTGSFYIPVPSEEIKQFSFINDNMLAVLTSDKMLVYSIK
jgi:hypothetical protein